MFEDIKNEINTFPLTEQQKVYISTALDKIYDKGRKDGISKSGIIKNNSEDKDLKTLNDL